VTATATETDPLAGIYLAEDIEAIRQGIASGSWIATGLGGLGAGLDTVSLATNPVDTLAAWGAAWLMEQVRPLHDALDSLAGDPPAIAGYAQVWHTVATAVDTERQQYETIAANVSAAWSGTAADAFHRSATGRAALLRATSSAASATATGVEAAGTLVAVVRGIVRNLIAEFVGSLTVRLVIWAAEEFFTAAWATPLVIYQVYSMVAEWVRKITSYTQKLVSSLRALSALIDKLKALVAKVSAAAARGMAKLHEDPATPGTGGEKPSVPKSLTTADRTALTDYTGDGYKQLNPFLRGAGTYTDAERAALQARADAVSTALAKLPAEPGTTYRVMSDPNGSIAAKYVPGTISSEHAFTSTSKTPGGPEGDFGKDVMQVVTGHSGRDVAPVSKYPGEAEILYDKGTNFKVTSRTWDSSRSQWVITMEEQ
jgi:hypothetical protein